MFLFCARGIIVTRHLASLSVKSPSIDLSSIQMMNYAPMEEVNTGMRWVDGKVIFRKVIPFSVSPSVATTIAHGISGLTRIIKYEGSFNRTDGGVAWTHFMIPSIEVSGSTIYTLIMNANATHLVFGGVSCPYNGNGYAMIYYIK